MKGAVMVKLVLIFFIVLSSVSCWAGLLEDQKKIIELNINVRIQEQRAVQAELELLHAEMNKVNNAIKLEAEEKEKSKK